MTDDDDQPTRELFRECFIGGLPDEVLPTDEECDALHRDMQIAMSLNFPELLEGPSVFDDQFEIKNGIVTKTNNPFRAMRSMASKHSRIDRTEFRNGGYVSTIAVVNATKGHPFETMAFGVGPFSGFQDRYKTIGEAKKGHYALVQRIRLFNAWLLDGHVRLFKKWWKRLLRYQRYCDDRPGWIGVKRHRKAVILHDVRLGRIPGKPPTPLIWHIHDEIAALVALLRKPHGSESGDEQSPTEGDRDYE